MKQEMGLDCIELINKKLEKQISSEQYYLGLLELHQKYPMPGHFPPLTVFQIRNYRKIKQKEIINQVVKDKFGDLDITFQDPKFDIVYENHIYPFNFQESAEMYIRHQEKLNDEFRSLDVWKKREWPLATDIKMKSKQTERLPYKDDWKEL